MHLAELPKLWRNSLKGVICVTDDTARLENSLLDGD